MDEFEQLMEKNNRLDRLAREVLVLSRNTLLVNLRFLDMALSEYTYLPYPLTDPVSTDGTYLIYNAHKWLVKYRDEKEETVRCYLHTVLHCVFRHMFIHTLVDQERWDLACDIAAEAVINELDIRSALTKRSAGQDAVIQKIKDQTKFLTAERIYHYLLNGSVDKKTEEKWAEMFRQDDHFLWYLTDEQKQQVTGESGGGSGDGEGETEGSDSSQSSGDGEGKGQNDPYEDSNSREQQWKKISERMQQDLETFSKDHGDAAGNLVQNLNALNREKYDYESFLKKFSVLGEKMQINDDEFDYVFYTYGLSLYGNVPLIEPLEYKEVKAIREFVIAIDTSGSVSGPQVQAFLNKTYNIMKSTENFFSKINVHIIQCDADIQEDAKITNQEEFDDYIKRMQLKGFGGTDFRPVFSFVDDLIREHEFSNLKGLIYFTDGYGVFPERKPDYETAFVFVWDNYEIPDVPSWAIKLVLEPEDILQ